MIQEAYASVLDTCGSCPTFNQKPSESHVSITILALEKHHMMDITSLHFRFWLSLHSMRDSLCLDEN